MELLDLGIGELIYAAFVMFVASVVRGYSGFGFSAVLVAGLAFIVDPVEAVSLAIGMEVLASVVQGPSIREDVEWRSLTVLIVAALVGNTVGVELLTSVDADQLRAATFLTLGVLTLLLLSEKIVPIPASMPILFCVGVVAGVINGLTAMAGLVLVLGMSAMRIAPIEMRGTLVIYFFVSDAYALARLWGKGELDDIFAARTVLAIPVMVLGVLIGSRAFQGASVESFRRTTLILLLAISVVGLGRLMLG